MPGKLIEVLVEVGMDVEEGDKLLSHDSSVDEDDEINFAMF